MPSYRTLRAAGMIVAALLLSSQLALGQLTQRGPKLVGVGTTSAANTGTYSLTVLYPPAGESIAVVGINNIGQVVGTSGNGPTNATIWNGTTPTVLSNLPGLSGFGIGINDAGLVAGYSLNTMTDSSIPTIWNGTTPTALGMLPGATGVFVNGLNSAGLVVGTSYIPGSPGSGFQTVPTIWNGTIPTALSTLGGTQSAAYGVNNNGQVVGFSLMADNVTGHAVIWNGGVITDLNPPGSLSSSAVAINNKGQVAGYAEFAGPMPGTYGPEIATVWSGTIPTYLDMLPGAFASVITSINNSGVAVGYTSFGPSQPGIPTIWNGTTATNLNTLLDSSRAGWTLDGGNLAVNDAGQIVGGATDSLGQGHSVLLTPSPVPGLQVTPASNISASGTHGGPFSPSSFRYELSATYGSVKYSITTPSWLTASPESGTVTTSAKTITFTVNASARSLQPDTYVNSINFYNTTNNQGNTTHVATLIVNPKPYKLTVDASPSADGTVSGGGEVPEGSSTTVMATAKAGHTFVQWTDAGKVVSTAASFVFTMPSANVTLVAHFQ